MKQSILLPGASGEQNQNREDFQSASQHIEDQDQLTECAVASKITGRTYRFHAGANVVETGQDSGEVGADREIVQRDQDETQYDDDCVGSKVGVGVIQNGFINGAAIGADDHDLPGLEDLTDISSQTLQQQQKTAAFQDKN